MSESETKMKTGINMVFFLIWGIISIISFFKVIEGIIEDKPDGIYIIIASINSFFLLIFGISYINDLSNKPEIKEENCIKGDIISNV